MLFDQELLGNNFSEDNDDIDEELTGFIDAYQQNKNTKKIQKNHQVKPRPIEKDQQITNHKKIQLPRQFQKAKRTLTKIVHDYFNQLKKQYEKTLESLSRIPLEKNNQKDKIKNHLSFYLNKDRISQIIDSISKYVGINYRYKNSIDLKFNCIQQLSKKMSFQSRKGSFSYLPECQKIINLNLKGQINQIKINCPDIKNFKLPDYATPVPFKDSIYFLDAAIFDKKSKTYKTDKNTYKVNDKGQISILQKCRIKERIKCSIVRDENFIYLLGGMVGQNKIITSSCERFCPKALEFQEIPNLNLKHKCPSSCILKNTIWLFSKSGIQCMEKSIGDWKTVEIPWNMKILPFQFIAPYSQSQLIIFGGVDTGENNNHVQIYNCNYNWVDVLYDLLPQKVSAQKIWGPSSTDLGMVVLSSVIGQNQPDLKQKNQLTQSLYFTVNGIYLNSIATTK